MEKTKKNIHVLHVMGAKSTGGAETFALRLIEAQYRDARFKVTCLVRRGSWMEKQLNILGIPTLTAPFSNFLDFRTKSIILNAIEILEVDVVQGWMNRACKNIPVTDVPTLGRIGGYYKLKNYHSCHVVAGNTTKICDYILEEGLDANEVAYLPNFTESSSVKEGDRERMRTHLNIPEDATITIMAARLHTVKGVDIAIRALEHLENTHLVVMGQGEQLQSLQYLAMEYKVIDRVHFVGWQRHISPFVAAADIWWAPSRKEPLGNIILDAWMHEKPVVASMTDGPSFLIEHEKTGLLFEIENPEDLAEQTQRLIDDKKMASAIAQAGYKKAMANYEKEVVLTNYYDTYSDMIANKGYVNKKQYKGAKNG